MTINTTTATGDCDCCTRTDVKLRLSVKGNMMQCDECRAKDEATRTADAKNLIEFSRKIDTQIVLKADVFEKTAVSFVALQGAVLANGDIPADRKDYVLLEEVSARMKTLTAAIFEQKAALVAMENERNALLHNAQQVAGKLRESDRAKFREFDVNYQPAPVKKPKTVKPAKASFKKSEVMAAAAKYGVPAPQVQAIIVSKNMGPDDAAKYMAGLMGLI